MATREEKIQALKKMFLPMTIEEAGEELLRPASEVCVTCNGDGASLVVHDEYSSCNACNGIGRVYRFEYRRACATLGLELPKLPPYRSLLDDWKRAHPNVSSPLTHWGRMSCSNTNLKPKRLPSFFPPWAVQ